jgi:signal peptidase I
VGNVLPGVARRAGAARCAGRVVSSGLLAAALGLGAWALLPVVAGWRPVVVSGSSMSPALREGDVVFFDRSGGSGADVGRIILVDDPSRPGHLLAHRVVAVQRDGSVVTAGDANRSVDTAPVPAARVRGWARLVVPYAGRVVLWRTHPLEAALFAVLLVALCWFVPAPAGPFGRSLTFRPGRPITGNGVTADGM